MTILFSYSRFLFSSIKSEASQFVFIALIVGWIGVRDVNRTSKIQVVVSLYLIY